MNPAGRCGASFYSHGPQVLDVLWICGRCRHGYLQALPTREYLPIFWNEAELLELKGTEAELRAEQDR
jgi:hypothetical protein